MAGSFLNQASRSAALNTLLPATATPRDRNRLLIRFCTRTESLTSSV